jgi:hypothetical protein
MLQDYFGSHVTTDFSDPDHPKLIIDISDLENVGSGGDINDDTGFNNVNTITNVNKDSKAGAIFAGLVKRLLLTQPVTNNDPLVPVYGSYNSLGNPSIPTRGGVKQLAFAYTITIYAPFTTTDLDLDNI